MRIDLIRLAVHNVNATTIALPTRDAGGEMLVRIRYTRVVFLFVFVLLGVGSGITALPESLDELVAFLVVRELFEGGAFFVRDDPNYVLIEPFLVHLAEFLLERLFLFGPLFFG